MKVRFAKLPIWAMLVWKQRTCRRLLDDGVIGEPVAAVAFVTGRGMEMWHPNPDFFYQPGAGPMFDVGPYYLTALVSMPDPNTFDGPVHVKTAEDEEWRDVPLVNGHTENSRGLGVRDMAAAIRENRPHRASSEMAFHVLDLMQSFEEASTSGQHIEIQSR